jgi:hypothetical protein
MPTRLCACPAYRSYKCGGVRRPWYFIEVPSISEWFILLVNRNFPSFVGWVWNRTKHVYRCGSAMPFEIGARDVLREVPYRYKATKLVLSFLTSARLVIVAAVSRLVR